MDEQSLEDLLALIATRNVTQAAQRRNISQSAYSRRLRAIEAKHSIALVDRSRRPTVPSPALAAMAEELEHALACLKKVSKNFSRRVTIDNNISIAATHTLSCGPLPVAINAIENLLPQHRIRLKSANQDICFQMLMTEEVSLMLAYETANQILQGPPDLVKKTVVTTDQLVPVCKPDSAAQLSSIIPGVELVPLVAYPSDIFLGRVMYDNILSRSPHSYSQRLIAGMTGAILSSVRAGIGIAWLPVSIICDEIRNNELVIIDDPNFPKVDLTISLLQLRTKNTQKLNHLWNALSEALSDAVDASVDCSFSKIIR